MAIAHSYKVVPPFAIATLVQIPPITRTYGRYIYTKWFINEPISVGGTTFEVLTKLKSELGCGCDVLHGNIELLMQM